MFPANVKTLRALLEEGDIRQLSLVNTSHLQGVCDSLKERCASLLIWCCHLSVAFVSELSCKFLVAKQVPLMLVNILGNFLCFVYFPWLFNGFVRTVPLPVSYNSFSYKVVNFPVLRMRGGRSVTFCVTTVPKMTQSVVLACHRISWHIDFAF